MGGMDNPQTAKPLLVVMFAILMLFSSIGIACSNNPPTVSTTGSNSMPAITATPYPGAKHQIIIGEGIFIPERIIIETGDLVTWVNQDKIAHSIVSMYHYQDEDDISHIFIGGIWDSGDIEPGQFYSRIFNEPGMFEYISLPLQVRIPMDQYINFAQVGVGIIIAK